MKEKTIQVSVDRIENNIAVLEFPDGSMIELNADFLPQGIRENNVIDITFRINESAEKNRISEVEKLQRELLNRNNR